MPKKRIIGINEIINNTSASAKLTYDIDASSSNVVMFFNSGGTSFVLEDAEGSRVRFWYITSTNTQGYFESDNNLQPRYFNNDSNNAYFGFDSDNPFFGEKSTDANSIVNQFYQGTPLRINISDLLPGQNLTINAKNNDTNTFKAVLAEVIKRTVRAINYADEIKISASYQMATSGLIGDLLLTQSIKGPDGNTLIDRNIGADPDIKNFYGILTDDIVTQDFSGGAVNPSTYENIFSERSGSLSNAVKKEINRKSFIPGVLPSNKITTGRVLTREEVIFDDSLTYVFDNKANLNSLFGIPISKLTINGKEELVFDYNSNISINKIYNSSTDKFENEQLLLRNSGIYSKPNDLNIQEFLKSGVQNESEESLLIKRIMSRKSLDNFVEQKRVVEDYQPYEEDFGQFIGTNSDFETKSIEKNSDYNIKDQKQIRISLDFNTDAYLVNTAIAYNDVDTSGDPKEDNIHYTKQINFLNGNKKAVRSNNFPTAYWNFINKRWEYLDINSINTSEKGFVQEPDSDASYEYKKNVFPGSVSQDSYSIGSGSNTYDFRESVKNNLLNRPICFSPSFRDNSNKSFIMQPTTSHGFPQKVNWQPHNNHILRMSDYIDENFIVEKIIVKGQLSANFEKPVKYGNYGVSSSFTDDYPLKQISSDYLSSIETLGLSFFILNQRKNSDVVNKSVLTQNSSFYTEALKSTFDPHGDFISDNNVNVYAETTFLNNSQITPSFGQHGVYQFENKHKDFYKINSKNNQLILDENFKNKFYYFDPTESEVGNYYEKFFYKEVDDWDVNNYNEDLSSGDIVKFNILDAYSDGVPQEEVVRELVSFSNLLLVNSSDTEFLNQEKFKNIDSLIEVSNNSIESQNFTIKSMIKNYDFSNFIDESSYTLKSNKTNSYQTYEGTKSDFSIELEFDYDAFAGSLSNFKNNLDDFEFAVSCPERFHLKFLDDNNESAAIFIRQDIISYKNFFNLSILQESYSQWRTASNAPDDSEEVRASYNFNYFVTQLCLFLIVFLETDTLVFRDNTNFHSKIGSILKSSMINTQMEESKKLTLTFASLDASTSLGFGILPLNDLAMTFTENNIVCHSVSVTNAKLGFPPITKTETLENNVNVFEGASRGKANFLGINSDRIILKSLLDESSIESYSNNINYNYYKDNTVNSTVNTTYLLKPEDELIFGINSYGNGDLIASILELHKNLDIILIGKNQSKEKREKNNESKSIKKVIKSSNERKTNIEGAYFTKDNYFSKIFNTKNFLNNKKVIGNSSSNEFGNWGGFITFEESDKSLQMDRSRALNKTYRKYFYDSILPNFIDIFSIINQKVPLEDAVNNTMTFVIDDTMISNDSEFTKSSVINKNKVLFKDEWLKNYIFNSQADILNFRNINNTINGSIKNYFSKKLSEDTKINININKSSYALDENNSRNPSIGNYTLPFTEVDSPPSNYTHRLPTKIYNNSSYNFIPSNMSISIDEELVKLNSYNVNISLQRPKGFDKWLLVIHDSNEMLENNNYPLYESFKPYIEQGNNDFEEVSGVGCGHLISTRSIPLTLHNTYTLKLPFGAPSIALFKHFSKRFKAYYSSQDGANYTLNSINTDDYLSTRKFFTELEYWEIAELVKDFSNDDDRSLFFGGDDSGFPYNDTVYDQYEGFVNLTIRPLSVTTKQFFTNVGATNFNKIFDFEESIGSTGNNFPPENQDYNCNLSISRYLLFNAKSENRPVLEKELKDINKFKEKSSIMNTIQTYIDKSLLEDDISKINNVETEFDKINTLSQDIALNEKIYESDVYYLESNTDGNNNGLIINSCNMNKTNAKAIFKFNFFENLLAFPYIKLLSIKNKSSLLNTRFNKKDTSIFLPKSGKLRIYEQNLLDIHKKTNQISIDEVPYFEIVLKKDNSSDIPFSAEAFDLVDLNDASFFSTPSNIGSKIFTIKKDKNKLINKENHEEWESFDDRDRSLNNFVYTFGKSHDKLPLEKCGGFKFGILNGHKTSPTYKFNAYNYGQFADFISYSTNAAFVRKEAKTKNQVIEYPVEKVFVNNYYNVVSTSSNTYNKDIYSRCEYPYIEDAGNELSQLHNNS
jgi:hypothetical protein